MFLGSPGGSDSKESACSRLRRSSREGNEWQPTPVFLSGEFHEWRNPAGYSTWGSKELDMTVTNTSLSYVFLIHRALIRVKEIDI